MKFRPKRYKMHINKYRCVSRRCCSFARHMQLQVPTLAPISIFKFNCSVLLPRLPYTLFTRHITTVRKEVNYSNGIESLFYILSDITRLEILIAKAFFRMFRKIIINKSRKLLHLARSLEFLYKHRGSSLVSL